MTLTADSKREEPAEPVPFDKTALNHRFAPNVPKLSRGGGEAGDVGCSAMLGGSAIDVFAMTDPNNEDAEFRV
jgi:hypothetical protein